MQRSRRSPWLPALLLAAALAGIVVILARVASDAGGGAPETSAGATLAVAAPPYVESTATPRATPGPARPPSPTVTPVRSPAAAVPIPRSAPGPPAVDSAPLAAAIGTALEPFEGDFSVAVYRVSDGTSAAIDAGRVFFAASLFKLAVLYEAGRRLDTGDLHLDDTLPINDVDIAEDDGTFADVPRSDDGSVTVSVALEAMITRSDTTTGNAFLHLFGHANIDATLASLGLTQTSVNTRELPTTAADMTTLMTAIVTGHGLKPSTREYLRSLLLAQQIRGGIPAGLPPDVLVGNKTGNVVDDTHDVAFVEAAGGTYIIAILSDRSWDWHAHIEVSAAVFREMQAPAGRAP